MHVDRKPLVLPKLQFVGLPTLKSEKIPLRILIVEDDLTDAELLLRALRKTSYEPVHTRVETEQQFRDALADNPEIVLSDYNLPGFSGLQALEILRESRPDIPFILISGGISEEQAVEVMRLGADDYLIKDRMGRLGSAITAVLEQRRLREEARQIEGRFRATFEQTAVGIVHSTLDGHYVMANRQFCDMLGYTREEILEMRTRDITHPDDREKDSKLREQLLANRIGSYSGEKRYRRKDGSVFWVNRTISIARDSNGAPQYLIRIIEDITRRKEQEERFRATFQQAAVGISLTLPTGQYLEVNDRLCEMLGYSREELLTKNVINDITHPDDRKTSRERNAQLLSNEADTLNIEKRYVRKDGTTIQVIRSMTLVRDPDGKPHHLISIISDVTESRAAERMFSASFEQASVGMGLRLPGVRTTPWLRVNQKLCDMLGYTREELLKLTPADTTFPEDQDNAFDYNKKILSGEVSGYTRERRYRCKDGSGIWCNISVSAIRDADGKPTHVIALMQDITDRKQAELRILRLNRLYSTLSATNAAIVRSRDRETLFEAICRIAVGEGGLDAAWIRIRDPKSDALCIAAHYGINKDYFTNLEVSIAPEKPEGRGLSGSAFRENRVMVSNDMLNDPALDHIRQRATKFGIRSMASLPLACNDEVIGVLGLQARESGFFDNELVKLLQEMAGDISFALTSLSLGTQHQEMLHALQESDARFRQLAENIPQIFWITDATLKLTIYISPTYEAVMGRKPAELKSGDGLWLSFIHDEDRKRVENARKEKALLGTYDIEYRIVHTDGSVRWIHDRAFPVRNAQGEIHRIAGIAEDVTERNAARERLSHLAHYDNVTGLANRVLFQDRLRQSVAQAKRNGWTVGLLFLDLDRFKLVNDTLGHAAGDRLLKEVAARLTACLRPSDTVGRFSGDEFAIILSNLASPQDAGLVAQKILQAVAAPFDLDGNEVFVTTSIGITLYPADSDNIDTLIRDADTAMYSAKGAGRNNYQYYTAELNERAMEKLHLEAGLRRALERSEFVLHYQPKVDIASGEISGLEALLRWQPPDSALVPPDQFIPLLEENGLIVPVGEWAVRAACAQMRDWRKAGVKSVPVAINLSARQLRHQGFSKALARALEDFAIDPGQIEIEITESSLMENPEAANTMLQELKALGIRLAADDFGTGYSSLSYLKRFPLDTLKIDRSFVRDITVDPDDAAIAKTVITLAHSLELSVVAEGVETREQLAFLGENRCDEAQGYLFSRPLPADACTALLKSEHALHQVPTVSPDHLPAVLVIDDDPDHLMLTRLLLERDGHRVLDAKNTREAFELLTTNRIGAIISDQNMPGMSGVEFLRRVKLMHPDVMRVMLSGIGDFGIATAAINDGEVHKFFIKGRDEELLRREISKKIRHAREAPAAH